MDLRAARFFVALCFVLSSCGDDPQSQTIVYLYADADVATTAETLRVTVVAEGATVFGPRERGLDRSVRRVARIPLIPRNGDANRSFEVIAELLDGGGAVLAELRVGGGYVTGELRDIHAVFDPECVGLPSCGEGRTCFAGECVSACYEAQPPTDSRTDRPSCGACSQCQNAECIGVSDGAECGCGDRCLAGQCDVQAPVTEFDLHRGHACATFGGRVQCWGTNHALRIPADTNVPTPIELPGPGSIAAGAASTCIAFQESGPTDRRACAGFNADGRLAIGIDGGNVSPITPATDPEPGWQQLEGGLNHFCGLSRSQEVFCWGQDGFAVGEPELLSTPTRFLDEVGFVDLDLDWQSTCAVHRDGRIVCFGLNDQNQLGRPDGTSTGPGCVEEEDGRCATGFSDVGLWNGSSCGVRDGRLLCWGDASPVRGNADQTSVPTTQFDRSDVVSVDVGFTYGCLTTESGGALCWGNNNQGQLGDGTLLDRLEPAPLAVTGDVVVRQLVAGPMTACAVDNIGRLWCWGSDLAVAPGTDPEPGLLGRGATPGRANIPRRVCPSET
ncbi:MAG: hypothetical protein AAGF12_37730 [Myxococcota bacterium]